MRIFIGIELDDAVRRSAETIAASLRERLGARLDARWIPRDNLHITLWFVGEVGGDRADEILRAVDQPFTGGSFDVQITGAGAFPSSGAPRVFWLGVASGAEGLARLHAEIAGRLRPLGLEPERRAYSAHLTIARIKALRGRDYHHIRTTLRTIAADAGTSRVRAVTVFRSRLSPKGATYEALVRVPLE